MKIVKSQGYAEVENREVRTDGFLSKKDWYERYIAPLVKQRRPESHFTFDMYGNKARSGETFDNRRPNLEMRALADQLKSLELQSLQSRYVDEFTDYNNQIADVIAKMLDMSGIHSGKKRKAVRRPDLSLLQEAIPEFTEFDYKMYGTPASKKNDNQIVMDLKKGLLSAYQEMYYDKNPEPLQKWYKDMRHFWQSRQSN